jgi:hypothetical protein
VGGLDPNLCPVTPAQPPMGEGGRLAIGGRGLVGDHSTRSVADSLGTLVTSLNERVFPPMARVRRTDDFLPISWFISLRLRPM